MASNSSDSFDPVAGQTLSETPSDGVIRSVDSAELAEIPSDQHTVDAREGPECAARLGVRFAEDLDLFSPSTEFIRSVPISFARENVLLGLIDPSDNKLHVVFSDLNSWSTLDVLRRILRTPVEPLMTHRKLILQSIDAAYEQYADDANQMIEALDENDVMPQLMAADGHSDLLDTANHAPIVKITSTILFEAVQARASDIHIHPLAKEVVVRFRIDGILSDTITFPKKYHSEIVSRIKVLAKMDIAERRLPQDGRATVKIGQRVIDLRIASLPTQHGERVVIRLLDKGARVYTLSNLGMESHTLDRFQEIINLEHGLILVTGPTGSGKSTTLYAALQEINSKDKNVVTLEDPIEYQLDGISQTQISDKKGMNFATGLRHVLRQDPDIIMVGEIRDHETAVMAIQSALTGHLVFSTLHTNDAASAITRLLDLGIEPYLVSSSLVAVMAQRLVRRICPLCSQQQIFSQQDVRNLGMDNNSPHPHHYSAGAGCPSCRETGYSGRVGLYELLTVSDSIQAQIQQKDTASAIRDVAIEEGMQLLRDNGIRMISTNQTTPDEVVRVTMRSSL